jgi:curved DNA binding protein
MADDAHMDVEGEEAEQELPSPEVVSKYQTAAQIANRALADLVKETVPGKVATDLCALGDKIINDEVAKIFNKAKGVDKGVAFPTCISVNQCAGHYSPLSEDRTVILQEGDLVKIDLGVQVDGFIAQVAHTVVATANPSAPTTGRKADAICAAHYAAEIAHRLVRPGRKNTEVTDAILKVAHQFQCEPLEGVLSHQLKRYVIDGNRVIINKATLEHKVEEFEFEENQVYTIDVVVSTGEGKARETELRTTIFKRAVDQNYLLKMKASRYVYNEITKRFPTFPFTLRALDEKTARLGITECLKHDLVHPYPVLFEKAGEVIAQFKYTVLVLPSGTQRLTSHPLPYVASDKKLEDPELQALLALSTKRAKKGKKKAAAAGGAAAAPAKGAEKMEE